MSNKSQKNVATSQQPLTIKKSALSHRLTKVNHPLNEKFQMQPAASVCVTI